jgi:PST family polysaccharide transporter
MKRPDLAQRSARGGFWAVVEVWGVELLQFSVFTVLARLLGPQTYGLIALAMIFVVAAQRVLIQGGWSEFIIQRDDLDDLHLSTMFWVLLAIGVAVALIMVAAASAFARLFGEPQLAVLLPALSFFPVLTSLGAVPTGLLERDLKLAPLALRSTLATALGGIIGVAMALNGFGVWSLVGYEISYPLLTAIVLWPATHWRPRARFSRRHLAEIMSFVTRIMGERLINLTEILLPRALIGLRLNPAAVGNWSLATKIFELSSELVQRPALRVALPGFAGAQSDSSRLMSILALSAQLTALFAVPGYVFLVIAAPDLVSLLFGPSWHSAGLTLSILTALGLITPFTQLCVALLQGTGHVGWSFALTLIGFVLFLVILPVGLAYGIVGVAAALVVRGWVLLLIRLWLIRRLFATSLNSVWRSFLLPSAGGMIMAAVMTITGTLAGSRFGGVTRLILLFAAGAASYVLSLWLMDRKTVVWTVKLGRQAVGFRTDSGELEPSAGNRSDIL